jgi:hypothetical protein
MHDLVDLGHSMTHAVVGSCRDVTRTSEHIGWTVANDNEVYLVAVLTCNAPQQIGLHSQRLNSAAKENGLRRTSTNVSSVQQSY